MIKSIFFDLDGTLLDTAEDLGRALNKLLLEEGMAARDLNEIRYVVSEGALGLIKFGFDIDESDNHYPRLRQQLLDYYLQDVSSHTIAFDGISKLIDTIIAHQLSWGIATNKPWTYTNPLMQSFTFAKDPIGIICPEHVKNKKPHPESLILACEKAGCRPQEMMYIGDHLRDIQCGVSAGAITVAAGYGYVSTYDDYLSWPADHFVTHASEIWNCIEHYL